MIYDYTRNNNSHGRPDFRLQKHTNCSESRKLAFDERVQLMYDGANSSSFKTDEFILKIMVPKVTESK